MDTTHNTFKWLLLLVAYYPEVQNRLRQEISDKIGDRMPVQQDIHECHYIQAFISETMRYRLVVPLALFHKAVVNTNIGTPMSRWRRQDKELVIETLTEKADGM